VRFRIVHLNDRFRLRPFKILIFSVFNVRFTPGTGPSRDRLVNYRFVPLGATPAQLPIPAYRSRVGYALFVQQKCLDGTDVLLGTRGFQQEPVAIAV